MSDETPMRKAGQLTASTGNDRLPEESRNPEIPSTKLGLVPGHGGALGVANSLEQSGFRAVGGNGSLPARIRDRIDPYARSYEPTSCEADDVRFVPPRVSSSTSRHSLAYEFRTDPEQEHREMRLHSELTLQAYARRRDGAITGRTIAAQMRDLRELLALEIYDPKLGRKRPLTVIDLCQPGYGPLLIAEIWRGFRELLPEQEANVGLRLLRNFRPFATSLCLNFVIEVNGELIDLTKRWGPLVCPIDDRSLPKPKTLRGECPLPRKERMPELFDRAHDWARRQRLWRYTAHRSAAVFIACCDTGMRGIEARSLDLDRLPWVREAALPVLDAFALHETKNGQSRTAVFTSAYARDYTNDFWLGQVRPLHAPARHGFVYPSAEDATGQALSSSSFSDSTGRLLRALKEAGLIDQQFKFHWCRKIFGSHCLERGDSLATVMNHGGWSDPSSMRPYLHFARERIADEDRTWRESLEPRLGKAT